MIRVLLEEAKNKLGISHEFVGRPYNELKVREIYERDFKPRIRILKRNWKEYRELRSRSRHYFVSVFETIAIIRFYFSS